MTAEEIASLQLTRVIETRIERDAETDRAFHEKAARTPSSQSEVIKDQRDEKIAEIREADNRIDAMLQHSLTKEVERECADRGVDLKQVSAADARGIGEAALEKCRNEYDQQVAQRESFTAVVDRASARELRDAAINEHGFGRDTVASTAENVLFGGRVQDQNARDSSASIVREPSPYSGLGNVEGPPRSVSKDQLLYELATPETKTKVDDLRQKASEVRQSESAAFNDPKVHAERVNAAMKDFVSKPQNTLDLPGSPPQRFKGPEEVRDRAETKVAGDHLTKMASIDRGEKDAVRTLLERDPNNRARFRSAEQTLDPRTNSQEAREAAVARVEERREQQRQLSREFNQKTDPLER
jgi:hypothetical protein